MTFPSASDEPKKKRKSGGTTIIIFGRKLPNKKPVDLVRREVRFHTSQPEGNRLFFLRLVVPATLSSVVLLSSPYAAESRECPAEPHNVVLFIPEGLNASAVMYDIAPAL